MGHEVKKTPNAEDEIKEFLNANYSNAKAKNHHCFIAYDVDE